VLGLWLRYQGLSLASRGRARRAGAEHRAGRSALPWPGPRHALLTGATRRLGHGSTPVSRLAPRSGRRLPVASVGLVYTE